MATSSWWSWGLLTTRPVRQPATSPSRAPSMGTAGSKGQREHSPAPVPSTSTCPLSTPRSTAASSTRTRCLPRQPTAAHWVRYTARSSCCRGLPQPRGRGLHARPRPVGAGPPGDGYAASGYGSPRRTGRACVAAVPQACPTRLGGHRGAAATGIVSGLAEEALPRHRRPGPGCRGVRSPGSAGRSLRHAMQIHSAAPPPVRGADEVADAARELHRPRVAGHPAHPEQFRAGTAARSGRSPRGRQGPRSGRSPPSSLRGWQGSCSHRGRPVGRCERQAGDIMVGDDPATPPGDTLWYRNRDLRPAATPARPGRSARLPVLALAVAAAAHREDRAMPASWPSPSPAAVLNRTCRWLGRRPIGSSGNRRSAGPRPLGGASPIPR